MLRYADKKVEGVDEFLKSAAKYEDLALSVPWLNDYIRDNPHAAVRISYIHDKSFGDNAMGVFAADMKLLGREDLIEQVKSQQAGITLLLIRRHQYGIALASLPRQAHDAVALCRLFKIVEMDT